jgi:phosphoglycerate dehydrogenase-like enzyme
MSDLSRNSNHVDVVFLRKLPEVIEEYIIKNLKENPNIDLYFPEDEEEEVPDDKLSKADILVGWRPTLEILKKAKNLTLFIVPGTGVHHLIDKFRKINELREVLLANGHGNSYFVAQHAVALLLTFMNKIIPHHKWMKNGKWRTGDKEAASTPLRFREIGLLGYGAINSKVHKFLSGFNVNFNAYRKHWEKQTLTLPTEVSKFEPPDLHKFLEKIDILFVAVPVTSETRNMIELKELELLGKKGIIINVARGIIIEEESLYKALSEKIIAGAGIDVWYESDLEPNEKGEKYPFHYPFNELDNIIFSPHRGYSPFTDLLRWDEVIENIIRMTQDKRKFINIVNLDEEY